MKVRRRQPLGARTVKVTVKVEVKLTRRAGRARTVKVTVKVS